MWQITSRLKIIRRSTYVCNLIPITMQSYSRGLALISSKLDPLCIVGRSEWKFMCLFIFIGVLLILTSTKSKWTNKKAQFYFSSVTSFALTMKNWWGELLTENTFYPCTWWYNRFWQESRVLCPKAKITKDMVEKGITRLCLRRICVYVPICFIL